MSNVFTLDSLREETIRRYAPTKVGLSDGSTVELKSILKLKQKAREEVLEIIKDINALDDVEDDEDEEEVGEWANLVCEQVARILKLITNSPRKLLAELDHEDPEIKANLHTATLTRWIGSTQMGEAESSPA